MTGFKSNRERRGALGAQGFGDPAIEILHAIGRLKTIDHYDVIRFDAVDFYCQRLLFGRLITQIDNTISTDDLQGLKPEEVKSSFIMLLRDMMQQHRTLIVSKHEPELFETARIEQFTAGLIHEARAEMELYTQWLSSISEGDPEPSERLMSIIAPKLGLEAQQLLDEQSLFVMMVRDVVLTTTDEEEPHEDNEQTSDERLWSDSTNTAIPNVLIDLHLAKADIFSSELDSEIAAANRRTVEEISSGALTGLSETLTGWFTANSGTAASPTAFGYTWYAHGNVGRMQLVRSDLLEATGHLHPEKQPGYYVWGSRIALPDIAVGDFKNLPLSQAPGERLAPPKPPERTREAIERRFKSMMRLRAERVHVNDELPVIQSEPNTRRRTAHEVANRAMSLLLVSLKGDWTQQGLTAEHIASSIGEMRRTLNVDDALSPKEKVFLDSSDVATSAGRFTWRYEALWVLLWSLGYIESLGRPIDECDVQRSSREILDRGPEAFTSQATLRSQHEILDECDLIYRYNWACIDSQINKRPIADLNAAVVVQRHWALNWLVGYRGQAWDDISTDT